LWSVSFMRAPRLWSAESSATHLTDADADGPLLLSAC
jgi:hypothetical protein